MCRFLALKSANKIEPQSLILKFAEGAKNSRSPDGDWQGDGWGICWLDDSGNWSIYKSLLPLWEDCAAFESIPATRYLLLHARSASFPKDKNNIHYNQPYSNEQYAFVFNGLVKGVKLPFSLEGHIGAQKIWSLLKKYLKHDTPHNALIKLKDTLNEYSTDIYALNIGLCDKSDIFSINIYKEHPEYYQLHYHTAPGGAQVLTSLPL